MHAARSLVLVVRCMPAVGPKPFEVHVLHICVPERHAPRVPAIVPDDHAREGSLRETRGIERSPVRDLVPATIVRSHVRWRGLLLRVACGLGLP